MTCGRGASPNDADTAGVQSTVTWVEVLLLLSAAGAVGGLMTKRNRASRAVMWFSLAVLLILLAVFGREFVADLM
jgi:hypothetical protein